MRSNANRAYAPVDRLPFKPVKEPKRKKEEDERIPFIMPHQENIEIIQKQMKAQA